MSLAASPARRSAGESPSGRSLRGERRRSDGTATTLRSCRGDLAAFRGFHALGTSMRRWGCAGRSYPSHSTSRSPKTWWEGCARREQVAPIQPEAGIGRVLAWACCVRSKFSHIWHIRIVNARPGARTRLRSTGRPLPAYSRRLVSLQAARSLCDAYGMHASRWQQQACVWNAASGGRCVRYHGNRCDLTEVAAPNGVRLQPVGIIWVYPASPLTTGRRDVRGRPR